MIVLCQRLPIIAIGAPADMLTGKLVVTCLVSNTDACGRTDMISENGAPEVSGPSACGMNDAYRRMIPVFWAVFIMRPYHRALR